ncbi:MAG: Hpt domain-containing protein [Proteobacteria bacterium]|nr:Hpt domain-containing protein [Pseudomonadota bacterium]
MTMVRLPHAELLELFLQEVETYLPEIRQGLATLAVESPATATLDELHRLFHNIKGAASQVQLVDLSRGARIVETLLAELVEEGKPASAQLLAALHQTVDLFDKFIRKENVVPEDEEVLYSQIAMLFAEFSGNGSDNLFTDDVDNLHQGLNEQQEYILATRSVLPLLRELAGYLSRDVSGGGDNNVKVYGKLSQAVMTLAAAGRAVGLHQQCLLMKDFHLLLEKLQSGAFCQLPDMPGLIEDFLRFLEAVYTYADPESSMTVRRVKDQLHGLYTLLEMSGMQTSMAVSATLETRLEEDIFTAPEEQQDESVILLEELADTLLIEEQVEDSELSASIFEEPGQETHLQPEQELEEETISEDQQLLLDIFRSECEEHLIVVNHSLNVLEKEVKQPCPLSSYLRETVSVMRRAVHTLKGAAAMTGMNLTARGAHSLEDMLDWLHDDAAEITPEEVQVIATGIDVIEVLSQSAQTDESAHLNRLVETINGYLRFRTGRVEHQDSEPEETGEEQVFVGDEGEAWQADAGIDEETLPEPGMPANLPGESGILRVKLDDLDELVGIEGELVVARGAIEKMLEEFSDTLFELDTVKENLRRKSQELEAGFEVQSLYGFNPRPDDETTGSDFSEFDPIELDRYSQLNLIIRSLNEISVDVNSIHATLTSLAGDMGGQVGKQQLTMRLMQEKLMRIRMTPMSSLSRVLFRTVRETAKKLSKKANLVITGEDVYMDRFVWAKITDPLMHMLRNATDHGIETPEKRIAVGKPESGTIRVEADQRSRFVVLRISDDGGGIDIERVREKVRRGGLAKNPQALSEKELLEFLFHPSFSTRKDVSTISGRGIGLDVVRRNIQDLRGSVQLLNKPGQGVTFEIRIPFTLSVNRAVMVRVADRVFAIPLQDIQQIKRFALQDLEERDGVWLRVGDDVVPVVNLGFCLQLETRITKLPTGREGILAILFSRDEKFFAVSVDEVVEQREIIVKGLGSHLTHVPGISGVTLTGSGALIPIVNLREIIDTRKPVASGEVETVVLADLHEPLKVLIVDDSISVRHSVARLVESQGWKQQQAIDGIDALAKLETFLPDVIVLDIEMPRMNGYEFKSNINNNDQLKDITVVMLTSRTSEKHQQKARELGVQHYMTKPYQEDAFIKLLANIRSGNIN